MSDVEHVRARTFPLPFTSCLPHHSQWFQHLSLLTTHGMRNRSCAQQTQGRAAALHSKSKQFLLPQSEMAWAYGNGVLHELFLQTRTSLSSDRNGKGSTFPALSTHNNSSFQGGMAWKLQLSKPVPHRVTPPDPDSSSLFFRLWTSPWSFGQVTSPMQFLSLGKEKKGRRGIKKKKKSVLFWGKFCKYCMPPLSFFFLFFIFFPLLTFTQAKQQEGPLMNVADRHGYGSEMQQKAIMVGQSREKKKQKKKEERNAPLCQNFRTAVITLLHPNHCKVTEILWHAKCQRIKYQDFNVTLFKKAGSINFQLHFQLVKSSRGNREKGASPWHRASHFEVWNKTLFSKAVECTCNRFNLTAAAVSYLSFVWFIFPLGAGAPGRDGDALLTFPIRGSQNPSPPCTQSWALPVLTRWVRLAQVWPTKGHTWFVLVWASAVAGRRRKFSFPMLLF